MSTTRGKGKGFQLWNCSLPSWQKGLTLPERIEISQRVTRNFLGSARFHKPLPWSDKDHIPYPGIPAQLLQVTASHPSFWDTGTTTFTHPLGLFYLVIIIAMLLFLLFLLSYDHASTSAGCLAKPKVPHKEGK